MHKRIGQWPKGMNNVLPDYEVPEDTLRDAVNMDVGDTGRVRPRSGRRKVYAGTIAPHTMGDDGRGLVLFVEGGDLKRLLKLDDGSFMSDTVLSGVGYDPMGYCFVNGEAFFSNGRVRGRVIAGGYNPLILPVPMEDPGLAAGGGELEPGIYRVALTFVDSVTREEGGAIESSEIELVERGGIVITTPPRPPVGYDLRAYVTKPNGEIPYQQGLWTSIRTLDKGPAIQTQFLDPIPAGHAMAHYNGRLFVAQGNVVWYSEPWAYGLCNLEDNHFQFPEEVDILVDVSDPQGGGGGIYVTADRTYFISGPGKPAVQEIETFPHRGVRYTGISHPENTSAAWVSSKGVAIGAPGGQVRLLTEEGIAHPSYRTGSLLYREFKGRHQFISTTFGGDSDARAFTPWS